MKTVVVCNTDINQLLYQMECKLGDLGMDIVYEKKYGISNCKEIKMTFLEIYNYKKLLIDIIKYRKYSTDDDIIDSINMPLVCGICKTYIERIIERIKTLIGFCVNCFNQDYTNLIISESGTADDWYASSEYLECLEIELIENGWIDPLVDLCQNLNIEISVEKLCKAVSIQLALNKISCNMITSTAIHNISNTVINNLALNKK